MSIKSTAALAALEAVNSAFAGRHITGSKVPTTERHLTRDQLFRVVHAAVVRALRLEKGLDGRTVETVRIR